MCLIHVNRSTPSLLFLAIVQIHNGTNDQLMLRFAKQYLDHYLLMKTFPNFFPKLNQARIENDDVTVRKPISLSFLPQQVDKKAFHAGGHGNRLSRYFPNLRRM